ncbi:MAG: hypothetical protein WBM50_11960, partial [Acidimicrobiales bacterium]
VELYESGDRVGGMAMTAAVAPAHRRLAELVSWLEDDARLHGVQVHLGHTVTAEELDRRVDAGHHIIIATGSAPGPATFIADPAATVVDAADVLAAIEAETEAETAAATDTGVEQPSEEITPFDELLDGDEIAIWDPIGGSTGIAIAELIAERRPRVSLVTPDAIAGTMLSLTGDLAGANVRLQQAGVTIVRRQRLRSVSVDGLDLVHVFTGASDHLPADVVVDASARQPKPGPEPATTPAAGPTETTSGGRTKTPTAIRIGDAVAPRTVAEAIREGRAAALTIEAWPTAAPAGSGVGNGARR